MLPEELEKLKKDLEEELKVIEEQLSLIASKSPIVEGDYVTKPPKLSESETYDESAHKITDYESDRVVEQNLEVKRKEIIETLEKIKQGTYGTCTKCQAPINEKRLRAVASSVMCLECAKKAHFV